MTHTTSSSLSNQHSDRDAEAGFTLIELLVVILIIGILAAIALPSFLGQRAKAQDANAKEDVRNLASQIEACWHTDDGYLGCPAELTSASTGLSMGAGVGQVQILTVTNAGYELESYSRSTVGGAHKFRIVHNIGGAFGRECEPAGQGGCRPDGTW